MIPPESLDITPYRVVTNIDFMPPQSWFGGGDTSRLHIESGVQHNSYSHDSIRCWQSILAMTDQNFIAYEWFLPTELRAHFPNTDYFAAGYFVVVNNRIIASVRTDLDDAIRCIIREAATTKKEWLRESKPREAFEHREFIRLKRQWFAMQVYFQDGDEYWS